MSDRSPHSSPEAVKLARQVLDTRYKLADGTELTASRTVMRTDLSNLAWAVIGLEEQLEAAENTLTSAVSALREVAIPVVLADDLDDKSQAIVLRGAIDRHANLALDVLNYLADDSRSGAAEASSSSAMSSAARVARVTAPEPDIDVSNPATEPDELSDEEVEALGLDEIEVPPNPAKRPSDA